MWTSCSRGSVASGLLGLVQEFVLYGVGQRLPGGVDDVRVGAHRAEVAHVPVVELDDHAHAGGGAGAGVDDAEAGRVIDVDEVRRRFGLTT